MKYLILIILFFLSSCIGSDNKTVKPLNDLIYNDDKPLKKVKNQIIKENKSSLKKKVIKKENKNSYKKKLAKKKKTVIKKNKKKVVKSIKIDKSINIYEVKNISEYEEYLNVYSKNSQYPNMDN